MCLFCFGKGEGRGLCHSHIPNGPSNDGDQLAVLKNVNPSLTAGKDRQYLGRYADCRDKGLHHDCCARSDPLDRPACDEEVDGAAKGRSHAQDGVLCCRPGSDLIAAASITGTIVRRVVLVEYVAFHVVDRVEDALGRLVPSIDS